MSAVSRLVEDGTGRRVVLALARAAVEMVAIAAKAIDTMVGFMRRSFREDPTPLRAAMAPF